MLVVYARINSKLNYHIFSGLVDNSTITFTRRLFDFLVFVMCKVRSGVIGNEEIHCWEFRRLWNGIITEFTLVHVQIEKLGVNLHMIFYREHSPWPLMNSSTRIHWSITYLQRERCADDKRCQWWIYFSWIKI